MSQHIQSLQKPTDPDRVIFEARLFIDGHIAGSKWFSGDGPWPSIIDLSIDMDKRGEFEKLKFPTFHKALLSQSYWNAGDDLGRIKLLISEGFGRDDLNQPFERIKNVVSFSFQHAPLNVLETSSIAWPNAAMWRQISLLAPGYSQPSPKHDGDVDTHTHSPRRPIVTRHPLLVSNTSPFRSQDPFVELGLPQFRGWRHTSDTSMADVLSIPTHSTGSRKVTDPDEIQDNKFQNIQSAGAFDSLCDALIRPNKAMSSAPVNTSDFSIIQNEKENQHHNFQFHNSPHIQDDANNRKPFETVTALSSGYKRQRITPPAAAKAIDTKEEPKPVRKVSHGTQDNNEQESRVLSGIQNV